MEQTTMPARKRRQRTRPRAHRTALQPAATGLQPRDAFAAAHGVSTRTVMRWVAAGLPCTRIGQLVFIPVDRAREWFASRKTKR